MMTVHHWVQHGSKWDIVFRKRDAQFCTVLKKNMRLQTLSANVIPTLRDAAIKVSNGRVASVIQTRCFVALPVGLLCKVAGPRKQFITFTNRVENSQNLLQLHRLWMHTQSSPFGALSSSRIRAGSRCSAWSSEYLKTKTDEILLEQVWWQWWR